MAEWKPRRSLQQLVGEGETCDFFPEDRDEGNHSGPALIVRGRCPEGHDVLEPDDDPWTVCMNHWESFLGGLQDAQWHRCEDCNPRKVAVDYETTWPDGRRLTFHCVPDSVNDDVIWKNRKVV
jgi:hypothetical protein